MSSTAGGQGATSSTSASASSATTATTTASASAGPNTQASSVGGSNADGDSDASSSEGMTAATSSGGAGGSGGSASDGGNGGAADTGGAGGTDTESTSTSTGAAGATDPGSDGVLGIIAVGYGGLRIVSRDLGETWQNETHWSENGGDDRDLLRTIAYGNGLWVSGGWRITTSDDGVEWTDRGDAEDVIEAVNCQVTDGMAFGNGRFLVACGSTLAASPDGFAWERVGPTPDVGGHPHLVFDEATEQFACSGDDGDSYVSSDGEDWTEIATDSVRLCDGLSPEDECPSFYYDGVYLSTEWGGWIRRSTTGEDFMTTYSDEFGNNLFTEYAFAVGRVAP